MSGTIALMLQSKLARGTLRKRADTGSSLFNDASKAVVADVTRNTNNDDDDDDFVPLDDAKVEKNRSKKPRMSSKIDLKAKSVGKRCVRSFVCRFATQHANPLQVFDRQCRVTGQKIDQKKCQGRG
jgi:hypothetical protein